MKQERILGRKRKKIQYLFLWDEKGITFGMKQEKNIRGMKKWEEKGNTHLNMTLTHNNHCLPIYGTYLMFLPSVHSMLL